MNESNSPENVLIFACPESAIGSREAIRVVRDFVKSKSRAAGRFARWFASLIVNAYRYVQRKNAEAAEMHNRATVAADERYQSNWYYMRGIL